MDLVKVARNIHAQPPNGVGGNKAGVHVGVAVLPAGLRLPLGEEQEVVVLVVYFQQLARQVMDIALVAGEPASNGVGINRYAHRRVPGVDWSTVSSFS